MFLFKIKNPFKNIYCISLADSTKRRKHIVEELDQYNIKNYEFVDAVNQDNVMVENAYSQGTVKLFPPCFRCGKNECDCDNNVLIPTQVATFFSHMKVWKSIAEQPNDLYLVIEDDIKFNDYYKSIKYFVHWKIHRLFSKNKKNPFLLRLGWAYNHEHIKQNIKFEKGLVKMSNPMYAINPEMAKKLLEHFKQIDTTVDIYLHKNIAKQYNNYTLFPPLAYELSWSKGAMESLVRPRAKRIEHLEKMKDENAKKELKKYDEHIDRAINRKLLAIGHPRTGSGYTSALLKAYGLDIGHEKMGEDGIVSWMFTVYDLHNPFFLNKYAKSRYYVSFENIIMFVRDPLTAIPSIMRENSSSKVSYDFRVKHILRETNIDLKQFDNDLERAIETYYLWSKMAIENNNPHLMIRVEYDDAVLFDFLNQRGIKVSKNLEKIPEKNVNKDKPYKGKIVDKPFIAEKDWLDLDIELKSKVNELCSLLNYESIFDSDLNKLKRV